MSMIKVSEMNFYGTTAKQQQIKLLLKNNSQILW